MPRQSTIGVKRNYLKLVLSAELEDEESDLVYLADLVQPKTKSTRQTKQTKFRA
jgi:hypothetical protein